MNRRGRIAVAAVGVVGLAAAVLLVAAPELDRGNAATELVAAAGNDYVLAAVVAALALLVVVAVLALRGVGGIDQATPPAPETVQGAPHPGVEFDRTVESESWRSFAGDDERRAAVRDRVRRAVVRSVMHRTGCSREEARARVASGSWTDDRTAAAFLGDAVRVPFSKRLLGRLAGGSRFERGAKRAVDELRRREDADGGRR
ncbi:DUF7269 family protein [Halogeometricum limi]|uniref:Uncharacterized protein n=1 Tax=Halogeometricum limi TaxID=555875 RepID=A0A1I6FTC5_9EURY|nr:hypothetical protein [Halogeometricum limi]SFR33148.1 hypothetical protein SAMN04488124_0249 [Halogeometricum limi]